jgi:hypothetical protein
MTAVHLSSEQFLAALAVGSAVIGFWIAVRFPNRTPENLAKALLHLFVSFAAGWAAAQAFSSLTAYGKAGAFAGIFGLVLPALAYTFLAGAWFLKLAHGTFGGFGHHQR